MGDKKAAEAVASGIRRALAEGTFKLAPKAIGFSALAEEWLEKYPVTHPIGPNTIENYTSVVRAHLIPHFKTLPVDEIGLGEIEDFEYRILRKPGGSTRPRTEAWPSPRSPSPWWLSACPRPRRPRPPRAAGEPRVPRVQAAPHGGRGG